MNKIRGFIVVLCLGLVGLSSCDIIGDIFGDDGKDFVAEVTGLENTYSSLETGEDTDSKAVVASETTEDSTDPTITNYTVTTYKLGEKYSELVVMDPATSIIYPGSIIVGETIPTGGYTQIVGGSRQPITISTSLIGGETVSYDIENPDKLSQVRTGINKLLTQEGITGSLSTGMTMLATKVSSSEELKVAVKANYKYDGTVKASVEGSFNFDSSESATHYLVKFLQVYYTIDVDAIPVDGFYDNSPSSVDYGAISPVYVASISYGRSAMLSIDSTASSEKLQAALDAAAEYGAHSGSVSISGEYSEILESCSFHCTIIGDDDSSALGSVTDYNSFLSYIAGGKGFSTDNPGSPISYTLKYVKDGSVAETLLYSEYTTRKANYAGGQNGDIVKGRFRFQIDRMGFISDDDWGDYGEVYGNIRCHAATNSAILGYSDVFNRGDASDQYLEVLQAVDGSGFDSTGGTSYSNYYDFDFSGSNDSTNKFLIAGTLYEDDTGGDTTLSHSPTNVEILLNQVSTGVSGHLVFAGGSDTLWVHYTVTPLD